MLVQREISFAIAGTAEDGHRRAHRPLYYGLQYNHSGTLKLRIDHGRQMSLKGAWVFITHPDSFFEYELSDSELHGFRYICMTPDSIQGYLDSGLIPVNNTAIRINYPEKFSQCMDMTIELINNRAPERHLRTIWSLTDLLLQLKEQDIPAVKDGSARDLKIKHLMDNIVKFPEINFDFASEAAKMKITLRHFRRLFRAAAGMAPAQFHLQCRINKAMVLLANTDDSVYLIGEAVGIDDPYYFSTAFKKILRISPSAYRKEFYSK